jgi:hypothetical protein
MSFDWSRLRQGEWLAGAGGLVLLASMLLLPWYRLPSSTVDGWNGLTHLRWLLVITVGASFALVYLQATRRAPALPVTFSYVVLVLGAISVLWIVYRDFISAAGSLKAGAWVGLVSACAIALGGYVSLRQEGISEKDAPEVPTVSPEAQIDS